MVLLSPHTDMTANIHPSLPTTNTSKITVQAVHSRLTAEPRKENFSHGQSKWTSSCITLMKFYTQKFPLKNVMPFQALNSLKENIHREIRSYASETNRLWYESQPLHILIV